MDWNINAWLILWKRWRNRELSSEQMLDQLGPHLDYLLTKAMGREVEQEALRRRHLTLTAILEEMAYRHEMLSEQHRQLMRHVASLEDRLPPQPEAGEQAGASPP